MSNNTPTTENQAVDNFAGALLALLFISLFVVIALGSRQLPARVQDSEPTEVAASVASATSLPTETPIPATSTPSLMPTNTLVPPTATPSPLPASPTPEPTEEPSTDSTPVDVANAGQSEEGGVHYDPVLAIVGEAQFTQCAACHGNDARGIPGLGKDMVDSEFVQSLTDEELVDFIKTGRPIWDPDNTTGLDMPPKGGNPALTDDDIFAIVAYIRSLAPNSIAVSATDTEVSDTDATDNEDEAPSGDDTTTAQDADDSDTDTANSDEIQDPSPTPESEEQAETDAASAPDTDDTTSSNDTDDTSNTEDTPVDNATLVILGEAQYIQCAACHGNDARGVPGLGKDLVDSEFVQSLTDEELVDFLKVGRPIWDPDNSTGLDMPPRGGNPALTDDDMFAIVAYIRSLATE